MYVVYFQICANYFPNPKASSLYGDTILGPAIFISNKIKSEWIA